MSRIGLLLRKDALMLRRSPLLLGILLAYPAAIAVLVGLVASYASAKPRVALVDEDRLPPTVEVGGERFHVDRTIRQVSRNVTLVRLSPEVAQHQLRTGKVVAVVTVPPGFIATLRGMVQSPKLELELSRGTISSRVEQQVQALVYSLNRQLQDAYIGNNLQYVTLILHGGNGTFLGRPFNVLGLERAEQLLARMPRSPDVERLQEFIHDARLALAFGVIIEIGGVTGGEPWRRLPLLVVGLLLAGGALGALGALLGALAREGRSASLVALLVVLPIVFLGLIPSEVVPPAGWVSAGLPFAHAVSFFSSALYDLSPWGEMLRQGLWLIALGLVFTGLARLAARRLLA